MNNRRGQQTNLPNIFGYGYSRAQITRLVSRWQRNRLAAAPLAERCRASVAPFDALTVAAPSVKFSAEFTAYRL
jgi:hypothetical protein